MAKSNNGRPAIALDPLKNIIRIHKTTLTLLGRPDYIQLLVNPTTMQIAIKASNKNDYLAHKVRWREIEGSKSYQLNSAKLVTELFKFNNNCDKNTVYRIYGEYFADKAVVAFDFHDATGQNVRVINNE